MSGTVSYQPQIRVHPTVTPQTWSTGHINARIALSNGNLTASLTGTAGSVKAFGQSAFTSRKYYFEVVVNFSATCAVGIGNTNSANAGALGASIDEIGWAATGAVTNNGTTIATWATYTTGQTIRIALDLANGLIWGRVGLGPWNNSGVAQPTSGIGGIAVPSAVQAFPVTAAIMLAQITLPDHHVGAFAPLAWSYAAPIGFGSMDITTAAAWANAGSALTVAPFTETLSGLLAATNYDIQIIASSTVGQAQSSTLTVLTASAVTPGIVSITGVTATGHTAITNTFTLTWTPDTQGQAPIIYNIYAANAPNGIYENVGWFQASSTGSIGLPPQIPSGLPPPVANVFLDDFNTLSLYNTRNVAAGGTWQPSLWYQADGAIQGGGWVVNPFNPATPLNSIYTVSNGKLGLTVQNVPLAQQPSYGGAAFAQGVLTTQPTHAFLFGYFEIRCSIPLVQGLGAAFWMMGAASPPEIDIFEILSPQGNLGNGNPSQWLVHMGLVNMDHTTTDWYNYNSGSMFQTMDVSQFHSYGVDWQFETITYYIDRQAVFQIPTPTGFTTTAMWPILELTVGSNVPGDWVGPVTDISRLPATMLIDYCVVYPQRPF